MAPSVFVFVFFIFILPIESRKEALIFFFGDSFFDPGNNNHINTTTLDRSNFPPYGETYFHFPTGRFSDGRIIPDFICEYARLPLIPPYMDPAAHRYYRIGANFASAGAGALPDTFRGSVISLQTQLSYHKRVVHRLKKTNSSNTLSRAIYLFSIGTNDYLSRYLITNSTHFHSNSHIVQIVIANLTTTIKELHKRGARKFGFINLGPLGCIPGLRILLDHRGCVEAASLQAKQHNQALSKMLKGLASQLDGFQYSLYNFNGHVNRIIKHPSKYGYKEGKAACCGTGRYRGTFSCGGKRPVTKFEVCKNPQEYVFWDSYHLTERVYKEMSHQMWNGQATAGTYNLKTLFQLP